ncbi:hypothetical protein [Ruegeria sp. HKCCSA071]|nr:hypothetical protein [Ruegeria sp. HKCCSA071]
MVLIRWIHVSESVLFGFVRCALYGVLTSISLFSEGRAQDQSTNSHEPTPDQMFVEAIMLFHGVSAKIEDEAATDLAEVARLFQKIQSDYPASAPATLIAAGGSPGGVDLSRLPPPPNDGGTQTSAPTVTSDLKTILAFLQSHYPETIEALQFEPATIARDSAEAAQLRIAYMIAVYVNKGAEVAGKAIIDPKQYMDVVSAMAKDGSLADAASVFSGQLALDIAEAKLQEVAASVFTDVVMTVPWPEMSPELENMLRAGLDAAFKEGWDLMKAQKDPSVIVGMIFNRVKDVRDIVVATNALNQVQEKALIDATLRIQTAAWIFVNLPDSTGTPDAVRQALTGLESSATAIVGKDDAKAVAAVFSHGFSALVETYRGNRDGADRFIGYIRQAGAESNIPPFNAVDALLVIANLGQDAPARAANIMLGITDLADLDATIGLQAPNGVSASVGASQENTAASRVSCETGPFTIEGGNISVSMRLRNTLPFDITLTKLEGTDRGTAILLAANSEMSLRLNRQGSVHRADDPNGNCIALVRGVDDVTVIFNDVAGAGPSAHYFRNNNLESWSVSSAGPDFPFSEAEESLAYYEGPIEGDIRSSGPYAAPQGSQWVQVASRQTQEEAISVAQGLGAGAHVFRAQNGWYAITTAILSNQELDSVSLDEIIANNGWPKDSFLTRGDGFVEEIAVSGVAETAASTRTQTVRETWLLSRYWRDRTPIYDNVRLAPAGESVVVWQGPDDLGDCLVDTHEGVFMKCADLEAFTNVVAGNNGESVAGSSFPVVARTPLDIAGLSQTGPNTLHLDLGIAPKDAAMLAGMLRGLGASQEDTTPQFHGNIDLGTQDRVRLLEQDIQKFEQVFRNAKIRIDTGLRPITIGPYNAQTQSFVSCISPQLAIMPNGWKLGRLGLRIEFAPIVDVFIKNGFGHNAFCADLNTGPAQAFEDRFNLNNFWDRNAFVNGSISIPVPTARSREFAEASAEGRLRMEYSCNLGRSIGNLGQLLPWGLCVYDALRLVIIDPQASEWTVAHFRVTGSGLTFANFEKRPVEPIVSTKPPEEYSGMSPVARAFSTDETGEDAIDEILQSFVGKPDDVDLAYQNITPFPGTPFEAKSLKVFQALGDDKIIGVPGTESGYGNVVIKETAPERFIVFWDHFSDGIATAMTGVVDDLRVLDIRNVVGSDCEWQVTYRAWLKDVTPFGDALMSLSGKDGITHRSCFRTTRKGFEMVRKEIVDF